MSDGGAIEDIYPLVPLQQGLLFHTLDAPSGSGVYVEQFSCRLTGGLDVDAFWRAWEFVTARHASLRTALVWEDVDAPVQVVFRDAVVPRADFDWRQLPDDQRRAQWEAMRREERRRGFELARAPLFRLTLARVAEDAFDFLWSFHHLILDGWSVAILLREAMGCYSSLARGGTPRLPPAPGYREYVAWVGQPKTASVEAFWRTRLAGFARATPPPPYDVTGDAALEEERYGEAELSLTSESSDALARFARTEGVTLGTIIQGAWAIVLGRLAGEDDVVFGSVVAGRPASLPGADRMVGLLVNTLPVRADVGAEEAVAAWLRRLQEREAAAREHEHAPLSAVQGWSDVPRGEPLFESLLAIENYPREFNSGFGDDTPKVSEAHSTESTNYPLTITVEPDRIVRLRGLYDRGRYTDAAIERVLGQLRTVLEAINVDASRPVTESSPVDEAGRRRLLVEWNDTERPYPHDGCVHDLFAAQASRAPDAVAIVGADGEELTYGALDGRANQLARWLARHGVKGGDRVGLMFGRSIDGMVAVLGVLKAGAAYVPLDPSHPTKRIAAVASDAGLRAIVTESALTDRLDAVSGPTVLFINRARVELEAECAEAPATGVGADDLAYVLYTSGSTGMPKGVAMPHRPLCNLIAWQVGASSVGVGGRTLQYAPASFDVSFQETFATWCAGGTLVLISDQARRDPYQLLHVLAERRVERLFLPFVALQQLALAIGDVGAAGICLREVITAGEQLHITPQVAAMFRAVKGCTLHNHYGPTESHVVTAHTLIGPVDAWPLLPPIGRPIANVRVYVLDARRRPAPIGAPGELWLGGVALARGYLSAPERTAERFLPDAFDLRSGARMYRTGDRARWRADGQLEFLGRLDDQCKVRGFRVEPGEIEASMLLHPAVCDAAVVARDDGARGLRLVGYVVARDGVTFDAADLRSFLSQRLPEYMIPASFVPLSALPLTSSGKVDRQALPDPTPPTPAPMSIDVPSTPTQEVLANLWSHVLGVERVGTQDDFFEMGGHSLLATQVLSRLRQTFAIDLPLRTVLEARTVARLAEAVDEVRRAGQGTTALPLRRVPRDAPIPLSFAQERMWFLDQLEPGSTEYNLPIAIRINGLLDTVALEAAFAALVRRHESFRTTFSMRAGRPEQIIHPAGDWRLEVRDASGKDAMQLARQMAKEPFDLARGPLLRVTLLRLTNDDHLLSLVLHHIVADGWSLGVLLREVTSRYAAWVHGEVDEPPELPLQYADFAWWQREWMKGEALAGQLEFWRQTLAGMSDVPLLRPDFRREAESLPTGASETFELGASLSAAVKRLGRQVGTTPFMTLLAAFQALLHRRSGETDIVVGTPIANRTSADLEGLIGCFINPVALRVQVEGTLAFRDLLERVRDAALAAYANQEAPFEQVVRALGVERDPRRNPLFQVMFVLQNAPLPSLALPGATLTLVDLSEGDGSAAFDLMLTMWEDDQEFRGLMEYRADLFARGTVADIVRQFQRLLEQIVAAPDRCVDDLELIDETARRLMIEDWNDTARAALMPGCVHEAFAEQARRTPDAVAVVDGDRRVTYRELERRANAVAQRLAGGGIGRGERVGLKVERSAELIAAMLGVLKAGAAYVPLDPTYPPARLAWMARDADVRVVLSHDVDADATDVGGAPLIALDAIEAGDNGPPPPTEVAAGDVAYVLYTSGSTGAPKGVSVSHGAMSNFVGWAAKTYDIGAGDRVLQFASASFDASVEEIFPALARGATLVLRTDEMLGSVRLFLEQCQEHAVSVLDLPTAYWHTLASGMEVEGLEIPECVRLVIIGGERARPEVVAAWLARVGPRVRLVNTYGPTETTVVATWSELTQIPPDEARRRETPIGRPIDNARAYVLDAQRRPSPVGVPGELYIGGAGVAGGYLNRPELTAERFVADPFVPGRRVYRTGDRARWRADGQLEFLGRVDAQVKLLGHRIEPGEVEAALLAHAGVREAAVVVRTEESDVRLVAYVVGETPAAELRRFLQERLPAYMIPAALIDVPALPRTASGKVDARALPVTAPAGEARSAYVAPRTELERTLAGLWERTLGAARVGVDDDFFALGGHSLLAAQLVARLRAEHGVDLPLRRLFERPTVAGIAAVIAEATGASGDAESTGASDIALRADAVLAPEIRPTGPAVATADGSPVLLTGATGFVGAALLAELLLQHTSAHVHCLVRCRDAGHGRERIREALARFGLWRDHFEPRLVVVAGDLARPLLGLGDAGFDYLANTIDAVYHCGAAVSAVMPYAALRAANVGGTREVLRLACRGPRAKPVHHVSTLGVFATPAYAALTEFREDADADRCDGLEGGYTQSKWVAERLVLEARARGLPVTVTRVGLVGGDQRTGVRKRDDLTLAAARACIRLGVMPDVDATLDLVPVDYVARAIGHLTRRPDSIGRVFHLANPRPMPWSAVAQWLRSRGYPLRSVTWEELESVAAAAGAAESLAVLRLLLPGSRSAGGRVDDANTRHALDGSGIDCPAVDGELLGRYLDRFVADGMLDAPSTRQT